LRFTSTTILLLLIAAPAAADHLFLAGDPGATDCETIAVSPNSTVDVFVIAGIEDGATGVRFRIPDPGCPGVVLVGVEVLSYFLSIGDVESGIDMAFAGCIGQGYWPLLKLQYQVTDAECCELEVRAHPAAATGKVVFIDCFFMERAAVGRYYSFLSTGSGACGYSPPVRDPYPADGATDVPVSFEWPGYEIDGAHFCPIGMCYDEMYELHFGADPDPPLVWTYMKPRPVLGPLEPETTYYWRIVVTNCGFFAESPVYRFTTGNTTPVESRTWGAVKALYRR
jgi:hypothetical protein